MYYCDKCGKKLSESARFCSYCGVKQPKKPKCVKCGAELPVDALFCHMCGVSVRETAELAAVKKANPSLDISKLTASTRANVCTSKKGFYLGDENYSLFRIKYFPYMGSLYRADKYDNCYRIVAVSEEHGAETEAAEVITGAINNVRIAAVNATGIYVIAVVKENEWFKTVIHRLGHDGSLIKSIALDTAENNNLRDMDICGTKIYYRTTTDDYFNVVYIYDVETGVKTTAYRSDAQRKILKIIGAHDEVYINISFTNSFEGKEYTDSGWYVYSSEMDGLQCVSSEFFPPHTLLENPECYDPENPDYVPPENRGRLNILAFDVVKQIMWLAEEDKAAGKYRIMSAPVSDPSAKGAAEWELNIADSPFTIGDDGVNVRGYRLFFDGVNMYWAGKYYEFHSYAADGKSNLISSANNSGEMQHFEIFDKTFYLPDFGAKKTLFRRGALRNKEESDMVWGD